MCKSAEKMCSKTNVFSQIHRPFWVPFLIKNPLFIHETPGFAPENAPFTFFYDVPTAPELLANRMSDVALNKAWVSDMAPV